jgi:glycosyltransferase involved in cell wall biosynthesis
MCTFNGAKFLQEQLDSIAAQTLLPKELVICDDNSTDETLRLANRFARRAPFDVRIQRNATKLGSSRNFALALSLCTGDLLALSDQDDVWYPQKMATLAIHFNDPATGGVFSDGDILSGDLRQTGQTLWRSYEFCREERYQFQNGAVARQLFRRNIVTGMTLMFRSSLRNVLLPVPPSWVHDGWFAFMIALYSKLILCPERLVGYRRHNMQQIGPPLELRARMRRLTKAGICSFMETAKRRNIFEYSKTARQFGELAKHLQTVSATVAVPPYWIQHAVAKEEFCSTIAAALALNKVSRLKAVLIRSQEYIDYTLAGRQAMVRDLLL